MAKFLDFKNKTFGWEDLLLRLTRRKKTIQGLIFLLTFLPVLVLGLLGILKIHNELTHNTMIRKNLVHDLASTIFKEKLDRIKDFGLSLSSRVQFARLVEKGDFPAAIEILSGIPMKFPYVERIFLADREGVLKSDWPRIEGVQGKNFSHRDWYQGVSKSWQPYFSAIYQREANPPHHLVAAAFPIFSQLNPSQAVGIMVLQIPLKVFAEWGEKMESISEEEVIFLDKNGTGVTSGLSLPGELVSLSTHPLFRTIQGGKTGDDIITDPENGEKIIITYGPVEGYPWFLYFQVPEKLLFATRDKTTLWNILLLLFILLLQSVLSLLIVGMMAKLKGMEEQAKETSQKLSMANKELEAFSYSVAHDLKAPLRAMVGFSRMIVEDYSEKIDSQGKDYLQRIQTAGLKMANLIDGLLNLAHIGRYKINKRSLNLSDMAGEIFLNIQEEEPHRLAEIKLTPDMVVEGDGPLLLTMLENLIRNSWKFCRTKNKTVIEFGRDPAGEKVDEKVPVYFIKDNGVGFSSQYTHKLFGVFQRLHHEKDFPGTGIGLATVRKIVEHHGGKIWAQGKEGEGATFFFTLGQQDPE